MIRHGESLERSARRGRWTVMALVVVVLPFIPALADEGQQGGRVDQPTAKPDATKPSAPAAAVPVNDEPSAFSQRSNSGHDEPGAVWCLALSPDGKRLATATPYANASGEIRIWNLTQNPPQGARRPLGKETRALAYSPDGKTLAAAEVANSVTLRDGETGAIRSTFDAHEGGLTAIAYSPDGKLLATAGQDRCAKLWSVGSGRPPVVLNGHTDWVNSLAFSPDGQTLATCGRDRTIKLWDVGNGTLEKTLEGTREPIES